MSTSTTEVKLRKAQLKGQICNFLETLGFPFKLEAITLVSGVIGKYCEELPKFRF